MLKAVRLESGRGLPQSSTLREFRQVLESGSPESVSKLSSGGINCIRQPWLRIFEYVICFRRFENLGPQRRETDCASINSCLGASFGKAPAG